MGVNIYIGHANSFDFKKELYIPLNRIKENNNVNLVFPHEQSMDSFKSKTFLKQCSLMIAEVSYPSTGLGIEMGWANIYNVPIICIFKKEQKISSSLKEVTDIFIEYKNEIDLVEQLHFQIQKIMKTPHI